MPNEIQQAFVNAKVLRGRLIRESVNSMLAAGMVNQRQVELHSETASNFAIGLDNPENPRILSIEIEFRATLRYQETQENVVDYESKHEMRFELISWTGIVNWGTDLSPTVLAPYASMIHDIAVRRAESTLHELGLSGARLPRPDNFGQDNESVVNTTAEGA